MSKIKYGIVFILYFLVLFSLFIYSFTQIDLNLTLSSNQTYQIIQSQLITLGYFDRSSSAFIFSSLILLMGGFYFFFIISAKNRLLSENRINKLILLSILILIFAYPAFSHDIFNYMFDARIITKYQANPYLHTALNFPSDLWTRFMHWTHRTYPYGPIWLVVSVPFSFLGFGKFVLTLFNFKLMFMLFHIGNIVIIGKINSLVNPKFKLLGKVIYALNPLILIESLLSPHNEVVMLFFSLLAVYEGYVRKRVFAGIIDMIISAGIKFITILGIIPLIISKYSFKKVNIDYWFGINLMMIVIPLIAQICYREPYPWYFIMVIGFGIFLSKYLGVFFLLIGISFGSIFRYIPYLFSGDYSREVTAMQNKLFLIPLVISIILSLLVRNKKVLN